MATPSPSSHSARRAPSVMTWADLVSIAPLVLALLAASAVILVDLIRPGRPEPALAVALGGLALVALGVLAVGGTEGTAFGGAYRVDALTTFLDLLFVSIIAF